VFSLICSLSLSCVCAILACILFVSYARVLSHSRSLARARALALCRSICTYKLVDRPTEQIQQRLWEMLDFVTYKNEVMQRSKDLERLLNRTQSEVRSLTGVGVCACVCVRVRVKVCV